MKRTFATFSVLFVLCASVLGQDFKDKEHSHEMREKIEAQKIALITQKLSLTPEEAQRFWPVYNELDNKKNKLNERRHKLLKSARKEEKTDKELSNIADELVEIYLQKANLEKEYLSKYKKILSPKKILKLYESEKHFHRMLLKRVRERGHERERHRIREKSEDSINK